MGLRRNGLRDELRGEAHLHRGGGREPDRARLGGAALEEAVALQHLQVVVDGGRGAEPDRQRDLANRRRVAPRSERAGDVVEDLQLPVCVVSRHSWLPWGDGRDHHTERVFDVKGPLR